MLRGHPLDLEPATGVSRVCSKQCCQCGGKTHTFLLTIWWPPHCTFSFDARRGWFEPSQSHVSDGGSDEDSLGGSANQSQRCAKSGEGLHRQSATVKDMS